MIRFRNVRLAMRFVAMMVALLAALPAWAVSGGQLRVVVEDTEQLPVPEAEVRVSSPQLIGGEQKRVSDANGEALFTELPPGLYTIRVTSTLGGVTAIDVAVDLGRTTVQKLKVSGGEGTEVEVKGTRAAVDVESTSRSTVLTKEFLNNVPTGQTYQDAISLTPGVTGQGGNKNIGGGATNENTYMLDGANITDPVTGTFSVNFNFDAIAQIEVLLGGYMPEYGTSVGGIVNLVTDSGSNELEFIVSADYTNGAWSPKYDARYSADGLQIAVTGFDRQYEILTLRSRVSGPIVRDKAWFILSYQMDRSLIAVAGVDQPRDFEGHYILSKLTVQPSEDHRLTAFVQLDPTTIDNIVQSAYTLPEAQGRQAQGGVVTQARWQWFLAPEVNSDLMFVVQKNYIEIGAVPCTHDAELGYHPCRPGEQEGVEDWETPGRLGTGGAYDSVNWGYYNFDDRISYIPQAKLNVVGINDPLGGSHDFKFGIEGRQLIWDQTQGYSGNLLIIDLNAVPYDPTTFQNYYNLEISGPIKYRTTGSQFGAFAQDSYKPVSNVTINYGVRLDSFVMRNDLGEPVIDGTLAGPRLFAAWDPFGDQKTKVATGWGRFNDTGVLGVADFTSASGYGSKLYFGEFFTDNGATGQGFLSNSSLMYSYDPIASANVSSLNTRSPRVDEVLLLLEREVVNDFAVISNMAGKFSRFMYEPDELNVIYDSDGSAVIGTSYGATAGYNVFRLRTPLLAKRDYFQWDLGARKVSSRRWQAEATYTYTQSLGSSTSALSGSFVNDPQTQYNYGPLNTDLNHVVKAAGFWEIPKTDPSTTTVGLSAFYYSGMPEERLYLSEGLLGGGTSYALRLRPRGTYLRFNPWWEVNLRLQQEIKVRKGNLEADVTLFNLFNNNAATFYDFGYIDFQTRMLITGRQDPLQLRLGLRYEY